MGRLLLQGADAAAATILRLMLDRRAPAATRLRAANIIVGLATHAIGEVR